MRTKVAKWGNSLALRLPKQVAQSQHLKDGVDLEILEKKGGFFIRRITKNYDLSELLSGITAKNLHAESFADSRKGKEVW